MKNRGNAASGTKYACRVVDQIGLGEFIGNRVDVDYGNGLADISGETGSEIHARCNTMRGPAWATNPALAFTQSSSSGTIKLGGRFADDNEYLDAA